MTPDEMRAILADVKVPDFEFQIVVTDTGVIFLRGFYREGDIVTGDEADQYTGKWLLSKHMVKSELVQRAFKCYLTSLEHQAREHFLYKGRRVFGPHFDVDALWEICRHEHLDYRDKPQAQRQQFVSPPGSYMAYAAPAFVSRAKDWDHRCEVCGELASAAYHNLAKHNLAKVQHPFVGLVDSYCTVCGLSVWDTLHVTEGHAP